METYDAHDWDKDNVGLCVGMLIFYWFITNLLAHTVLEVKRDNYHLFRQFFDKHIKNEHENNLQSDEVTREHELFAINPIAMSENCPIEL